MQFGAVLPHNEIGTDPGAITAYAQGLEELGAVNLLVYDHVIGAERERPGGFAGPYDKDTAFHEPFTVLSFIAAVTRRLELVTAILILPQRQTVLVAKQAAELAVLSGNRLRLGIGPVIRRISVSLCPIDRTWVLGDRTSDVGRRTSDVGRRTSDVGRRRSGVGRP